MSIMCVLSFAFANILKFSINVCLCATEEKNSDQQEADIFFKSALHSSFVEPAITTTVDVPLRTRKY